MTTVDGPTDGGPAGGVPPGVGRTALGVAMVRAMESRRRDPLFLDPYAAAFVAAAPAVFDRAHRGAAANLGLTKAGAGFWSRVVVRTRFFDDYLRAAAPAGVEQVVILASGLDTRAYRLDWPAGMRVFELDLPEVLAFKRRVLDQRRAAPRCHLRLVAGDLRGDWATPLVGAGLRPDRTTAWLLEGLLIYLSADETTRLLARLGELSAPGSRVAFEFESTDADTLRNQAGRLPALAEYAALWQGGHSDLPGWLATHGWRPETHHGADIAVRYGRSVADPDPGGFVTATRTQGLSGANPEK